MASAPGQIFIFGEHAVVYGYPALATTIDIRTIVKAKPRDDYILKVFSKEIGKLEGIVENKNDNWIITDKSGDTLKLNYVVKAIESTLNYLDDGMGFDLEITSDIPPGSGLGSSSAVTTATISVLSKALNKVLSKEEISELSFTVEKSIQGTASRTGVSLAVQGGFAKIQEKDIVKLGKLCSLDIIIGYTGMYGSTTETVQRVKKLMKFKPTVINTILETIGSITENGINSMREKNFRRVGALMNANQNLLQGLDVSSDELNRLISASKKTGALGAKITGGGGGGSMIALGNSNLSGIAEAIKNNGGYPIVTEIGVEGLKLS